MTAKFYRPLAPVSWVLRSLAVRKRSFALVASAAALASPMHAGAQRPIGVVTPSPALQVPPGAVTFLVVGDWGRRGQFNQRKVARAMASVGETTRADFVISTGDNFYPDGVRDVKDRAFRQSFEDVYTGRSLLVNWYVVLGNHDYRGNAQAEVDYSAKSLRWRMPARYFATRHEIDDTTSVEFFFLDTNPFIKAYWDDVGKYPGLAGQDTVAQRRWLDSALVTSKATWKFVVGHHHIYSGGLRDTNVDLESFLVPRLEQHGVTAYLCGHEHVLQHVVRPGGSVQYFISGAGSEVRQPGDAAGTRYAEGRQGFLAFSVSAALLTVQAIDLNGRVRYVTRSGRR